MTPTATTKMLTIEEVAERLHICKRQVEQLIADKLLQSCIIGKRRRVSEEALARFVLEHTVKPRRPDWLTPNVEGELVQKLREIVLAVSAEQKVTV